MKRRTFVWLSAVSAASVYIPATSCHSRNSVLIKKLAQPQFLSHICDEKTLAEIGAAYKIEVPDEWNEQTLANLVLTDSNGHAIPESTDSTNLYALLNQTIIQDFEMGRTVIVNGWVLSQTEARQCALLS
jgi:hypothetical protein